jgi:hypothetical protein
VDMLSFAVVTARTSGDTVPIIIVSYTWDNSCFTVSENPFFESGTDGKFDATFTNWCTEQEPVTVILACSSTPQPGNPSRGE